MNNICNSYSKKQLKQKGFTLLEILIAITLLSFLMIGVYSIFDNSTTTKDRVLKEDRDFLQVLTALTRIEMDFSLIYSPLYYSAEKKNTIKGQAGISDPSYSNNSSSFIFSENFPSITKDGKIIPLISYKDDSLTFMSAVNQRKIENTKESRYTWIRYQLRLRNKKKDENLDLPDNYGQYELIRYSISLDPYRPETDFERFRPQKLLQGIKVLKFSFWDKKNKKFVERLEETTNKLIIYGLKLNLIWTDINGIEQDFEQVMTPLWPNYNPNWDRGKTNIQKNFGEQF